MAEIPPLQDYLSAVALAWETAYRLFQNLSRSVVLRILKVPQPGILGERIPFIHELLQVNAAHFAHGRIGILQRGFEQDLIHVFGENFFCAVRVAGLQFRSQLLLQLIFEELDVRFTRGVV
jgi:hypothetical protein